MGWAGCSCQGHRGHKLGPRHRDPASAKVQASRGATQTGARSRPAQTGTDAESQRTSRGAEHCDIRWTLTAAKEGGACCRPCLERGRARPGPRRPGTVLPLPPHGHADPQESLDLPEPPFPHPRGRSGHHASGSCGEAGGGKRWARRRSELPPQCLLDHIPSGPRNSTSC